ncbi:conserved hypothetical protein [Aspergillus terreus NIH2624]|uniref:Sm domain-containing protein n=1 Tax=Aspergillus terreus (strain NIH 2624 / FGSC A1156) TaxID=341663 RepID=Q0CRN1_ASPTN|nr:uncharacterized protein ATEG_03653 [Aspergillus terreus NIH2624]EAU35455.1 conserved hypothetical protein [Aspergillus terreus NIH2624]
MNENQAVQYLESLIGQTLRIHASDTRIFVGSFKCTDAARNIILGGTYEYRYPTPSAVRDAAADAAKDPESSAGAPPTNVQVNMTSRFIGLVVIPGQHITKIELEETPQQARVRDALRKS